MLNELFLQRIKEHNKYRNQEALELKYAAMAEDPFRFFRGTCPLFYEELSARYPFMASPPVWICGDLHIENFGCYKGPNRLIYFDINDFDEGVLAPALWDIIRLAASVQLAAETIGFSKEQTAHLVNTLLYYYRFTLEKGKAVLIERDAARGIIKKLVNKVAERKETDLIKKRTEEDNPDKLLITDRLFALSKPIKKDLIQGFNKWLEDNSHKGLKAIDAGFRIAGTGSIGVTRYLVLLKYTGEGQKKLLLDVKQIMPSALSGLTGAVQPLWKNEAERVMAVQEMMQHVSPAYLSVFKYQANWFVVKELQITTDKINLSQAIKQPGQLEDYLANLGILSASGHLRSSGRKGSATADDLLAFATTGNWVAEVAEWSVSYAALVQQQFDVYRNAWGKGYFNE